MIVLGLAFLGVGILGLRNNYLRGKIRVTVFPDELYPAPRSWTEQAYPNLIHYNRLPKGGHFAAFEQPAFFTEELRTGLRSLRH